MKHKKNKLIMTNLKAIDENDSMCINYQIKKIKELANEVERGQ